MKKQAETKKEAELRRGKEKKVKAWRWWTLQGGKGKRPQEKLRRKGERTQFENKTTGH